ncbi:MAG: 50S ribosomal protein L10 [Candidatus Diapherotrites archaeon]
MTRHTRKWKEQELTKLKKLIESYPIIAIADITKFPSSLFIQIRKKLRQTGALVKVSKTILIKKALEEYEHTKALAQYATGNCALIFTKNNPFELYNFLKKNKGKVAAKEGAIAEEDIVIPAGDTGLPPGPALSDLKGAGLKVAVKGSTISVLEDKVVTKAGEKVSAAVAGTLSKLGMKPFKIGMKILAVIEQGKVLLANVLDIDSEKVFNEFVEAQRKALNLAINATIINNQTSKLLIQKAYLEAKNVAIEANILTKETTEAIIAKAKAQADAIKGLIKE